MTNYFLYLIQSAACIGLFYAAYHFLLNKERFFQWNRAFLIGGLLFSLLLPTLPITYSGDIWWKSSALEVNNEPSDFIKNEPELKEGSDSLASLSSPSGDTPTENILSPKPSGTSQDSSIPFIPILFIVYILGVLWKAWGFGKQFSQLVQLIRIAPKKRIGRFKVLKSFGESYSFGSYMFIDEYATEDEKRLLFAHERMHAEQWHTIDMLFLELIGIIYWFYPLISFYRKALVATHEYLVDREVLTYTPKSNSYLELLWKQSTIGTSRNFTHAFNDSLTKNRILMMNQTNEPHAYWKLAIALPIIASLMLAFVRPEWKTIKINPDSQSITKLSEVVSEIRYQRLDLPKEWAVRPEDGSRLKYIHRMIPFKNRWFLEVFYFPKSLGPPPMKGKRILIFGENGVFMGAINELFDMGDRMTIDKFNDRIIVGTVHHMKVYDLNGFPLAKIDPEEPLLTKDVLSIGQDEYLVRDRLLADSTVGRTESTYQYYRFKPKEQLSKVSIPSLATRYADYSMLSCRNMLSQHHENLMFLHGPELKIYKLEGQKSKIAYNLDFGAAKHYPLGGYKFRDQYLSFFHNLVESDDHIAFSYSYQKNLLGAIYSKRTGNAVSINRNSFYPADEVKKIPRTVNDIDGANYYQPIQVLGNELVGFTFAKWAFTEKTVWELSPHLDDFRQSLDDEDIVLAFYTLKDF